MRVLILAAIAVSCMVTVSTARGERGWSPNSIVKKLVITGDGGVNVLLEPKPVACVSNSGYGPHYASVYPNHPGINRIKATLLLAYQTEKPVALYYAEDNTCRVVEIQLGGW
jgi:hypothetical protein